LTEPISKIGVIELQTIPEATPAKKVVQKPVTVQCPPFSYSPATVYIVIVIVALAEELLVMLVISLSGMSVSARHHLNPTVDSYNPNRAP
jgi:hypothetical protein